MDIPKEVIDYYKDFGMTKQDILQLHTRGIVSFKTKADTKRELQALIKELEAQSG